MRFFRRYNLRHWTIGCDLKNGALLQFTKTEPASSKRYLNLRIGVFSATRAFKDISKKETRTWVNFGWGQGFGYTKI